MPLADTPPVSPTHIPVLKQEVLDAFSGVPHQVHIDGTTGLGGHLEAVLSTYPEIRTALAIDMDPLHLSLAQKRLANTPFADRIRWHHGHFEHMLAFCQEQNVAGSVSSILLDLGLCSAHVDMAERGFSFLKDGPLDMRFDTTAKRSAADIVHNSSEEELATMFWRYGEERYARKLAQVIVERRKKSPFTTTTDLADVIKQATPAHKQQGIHPATRVFQALRIVVNDELGQIERVLQDLPHILGSGGRVAVITYHSLEDRIVKHAFKELAVDCVCPKELPMCVCGGMAKAKILTKKPLLPSEKERELNPRSRSAKLRLLQKI
ncbi:16S rRNA (cytosine(1402)-N(4))-methyltransferase [Candidatus Gracilibacteria bacterium CG17_big_fil_post_rev_8_21_14_2_50_48_13]|nr:MAG: 16S rRNA (cytosine(1402)-N(4))-methyltransferase [Candidatus Gracilibacteria bacterium CG17_big_fil_post_rev_8_21_14_2_50_48_13]